MAKRFTDTDKWKKPFIKSLPVEYKLFWIYLLDECDHAGIWHVEIDLAELRLGIKLSITKIRGLFKEKVVEFDNESKWFIPDFICFQYGNLDEKNRAHKSVIDKLNKYDLLKNKGHTSPLQGAKDKDKEMDKDIIGEDVKFLNSKCLEIALKDEKWVRLNNTNISELNEFNEILDKRGEYERNPKDYKSHFSNWKAMGKVTVAKIKQMVM